MRAKQNAWGEPRLTRKLGSLVDNANVINKARLFASSTKESGSWLNALPVSSVGNMLDGATLRISVALRLGAPICQPHRCICGCVADKFGHHTLSCKKSKGRQSRHAALNEAIKRALASAMVPSIREPPGLDRRDGKRPDGLTQYTWKNGKCMVWDVTCVDTVNDSYIGHMSLEIQRGNAMSILGTVDKPMDRDELFFLLGMRNF